MSTTSATIQGRRLRESAPFGMFSDPRAPAGSTFVGGAGTLLGVAVDTRLVRVGEVTIELSSLCGQELGAFTAKVVYV